MTEIQILLKVRGKPNFVQIQEMGRETDGTVFFSTDLYDGSLLDLLNQHKCLSEPVARSLMRQLLTGLGALHDVGFVHRDVKPENILVSTGRDCSTIQVALADLGSAAPQNDPTMTGYVTSRFYRSPEMVFRDPNYGPKVDIWACGCVAFEVLTGVPLFPAKGEADLLLRMCSVLGSPPLDDERIQRMLHISVSQIPPSFPKQSIRRWFAGTNTTVPSGDLISLLEKLVCWVPDDRLDCAAALRTEPFLKPSL